jgi:HTH-type transcriptional regulator / antitoxin HigA
MARARPQSLRAGQHLSTLKRGARLTQRICCVPIFLVAILNQRDYRLAKARLAQLQEARAPRALLDESTGGLSADITEARRLALRAEHERLREEIRAYESLRSQVVSSHQTIDSSDLGMLPIFARIARGWSQKQLADVLDLKEQQIQRYESERYAGVSLTRYERILEVLTVELQAKLSDVAAEPAQTQPELELSSALIREIRNRSWLEVEGRPPHSEMVEAIQAYIRSGLKLSKSRSFNRQNLRHDSNFDETALFCWRARVLQVAYSMASRTKGRFNIAEIGWLQELVQLSASKKGPIDGINFLRDKGIIVVIEPHLARTRLDGAAFLLSTGTPVVGMTLRHDRLDYFWFTLLHEVGHVFLHFNHGLESGFFDDLDVEGGEFEREADTFARSALIPDEIWKSAPARFSKAPDLVKDFATSQGIHVSIVAGRLRQERRDYTRLSDLVGQGEVRKMLLPYQT